MAQRFTFDTSFDHIENSAARRPMERRYTSAELAAAREAAQAEGYAAGEADALAAAAQSAAAKTADSLARIADGIAALIAAQDAARLDTERRSIAALRGIIAKLLPGLAARDPLAEVESFARDCLHEIIDEPRVVLRAPAALYDALRERLEPIAAASGYGGRIVLLADEALADGDARIEWADGGAERDLARQIDEIAARLARHTDQAAMPAMISSEENDV